MAKRKAVVDLVDEGDYRSKLNVFIWKDTVNQPVVMKKYFFEQDSTIDAARTIGIRVHFNESIPPNTIELSSTVVINGVTYNVINLNDYQNLLITLVDRYKVQKYQRMPASAFYATISINSGGAVVPSPEFIKWLDIDLRTGESFLQFTKAITTPLPFVVPFSLFYNTD